MDDLQLYTTITRDGLVRDVIVEFSEAATFERAELYCPEYDDHRLTPVELQVVRVWFQANHDKAVQALADRFEREPANDNLWRGLEA